MANLLEQIVGTTVPNGYIYRTASGTDYFYNDGSWVNCKSMTRLSESKNTKMNVSALNQITEHNKKSTLQIGEKYNLKEGSYVYVGRGVLTKNGAFISEDEQNSVLKMITESSDAVLTQVPPGYKVTYDSKSYIKKEYHIGDGLSVSWAAEDGKSPSGELSYLLTKKALMDIYNFNRRNSVKIGTNVAVDVGGREKWYTFLGDGFSIGYGTNRVEKDSNSFNRVYQQMEDGENTYPPKNTGSLGIGSAEDLKYEVEKVDEKLSAYKAEKSGDDSKSTSEPTDATSTVNPSDDKPVSTKAPANSTKPATDTAEPQSTDAPDDSSQENPNEEPQDEPVEAPSVGTVNGIPDQYTVLAGKVTFQYSKKSGWFTKGGDAKLTAEQQQQLTAYANKQIAEFNNHDAVKRGDMPKIGTTVKNKGKEYTFLGQVQGYVDQFGNRLSLHSEDGAKLTQEIKASPEKTAPVDTKQEPANEPAANDTQDEPQSEPSAKEEATSTVKPAPEVAPQPEPAKVKKPADALPADDKEVKESDVESKVPNGFAIQSSSGKSYYKVNGQWFNAETDKVLNSGAAKMVERNAEKLIDQYNTQYSGKRIPIGQKYTSKQGNEYIWSGDKFYDKKGRTLPVTIADQVVARVKQDLGITDAEDTSNDEPVQVPGPDVTDDSTTNTGSTGQNDAPNPKATVTNINQNRMNQGPAGNDEDIDPHRHLDPANDSDDIEFDEVPDDTQSPADDASNSSDATPDDQSDVSQQDGESTDSFLKRLADKIKAHPLARRIIVLLGRGDDLSLMAADILLNNEQEEARKIIQSLNSNDNTQ